MSLECFSCHRRHQATKSPKTPPEVPPDTGGISIRNPGHCWCLLQVTPSPRHPVTPSPGDRVTGWSRPTSKTWGPSPDVPGKYPRRDPDPPPRRDPRRAPLGEPRAIAALRGSQGLGGHEKGPIGGGARSEAEALLRGLRGGSEGLPSPSEGLGEPRSACQSSSRAADAAMIRQWRAARCRAFSEPSSVADPS